MNDQLLVSVIIPVHNGASTVRQAIDSAAMQTYPHLEIILVDDGSTDGTLAILQEYAARDPRIRVIAQQNGGVAKARNAGIAASTAEFFAPLDADDMYLPDKISRQVEGLLAAGPDTAAVYCWWVWIDATGAVMDRSPRWTIEGHVLEQLMQINFVGCASVPLFRKSAAVEVGGYNSRLGNAKPLLGEDWDLMIRIAERHSVVCVPEILMGYRHLPGSMSTACQAMWRSQQAVMQHLRQRRPDLKARLFRSSEQRFAMYLAGQSYRSGKLADAIRWTLRAGLLLPLRLSPYVLKARWFPRRNQHPPQIMRPGERIDTSRIPEPLLPYGRILYPE